MFVVKVFCKIARLDLAENFHHEHFIDPTNYRWVSEDVKLYDKLERWRLKNLFLYLLINIYIF